MPNESRDRCAEFGRRLRALRTRRGIAQEHLAHMAGLDRNYITEAERGRSSPSLKIIGRLADVLGVPDIALSSDEALAKTLDEIDKSAD